MQYLKTLKNEALLTNTKEIAARDRKNQLDLLHHLREIESRKLYLKIGYSSLHKYVCQELKYSGGSANRRIQAMYLIKDVPEVEEKLATGSINLTTATQVQTYLAAQKRTAANCAMSSLSDNSLSAQSNALLFSVNNESLLSPMSSAESKPKAMSKDDKQGLIEKLENKSTREVERHLLGLLGQEVQPQEKLRQVTATMSELKLIIPDDLLHMLDELKLKYSHVNPKMTYQELIKHLATKALKPVRERKGNSDCTPSEFTNELQSAETSPAKLEGVGKTFPSNKNIESENEALQHNAEPATALASVQVLVSNPNPNPRYISAQLRRKILARDEGCCTYTDPQSGKRCGSKFRLQADHIHPYALGGKTEESNLTTLCANHNRYRAEQTFGPWPR